MATATGTHTDYRVTFSVEALGNELRFSRNVMVIDGYTTLDDIPRILAVALWADNKRANEITIHNVEAL